jgi:hypothetical protein
LLNFSRYVPALILSAGLLPSAWLLYRFPDTPQLGSAVDDVLYIGAATSLANHQGYREAAIAGNFWQTKYPPGYPLMLAAVLKLNLPARNFWIIVHSWLWLAAASLTLAWAMMQAGLNRVQAATVGALWTANPAASYAGTFALSDTPYCAVLFLAIGLAQRTNGASARIPVIAGALIGVACTIRTAGIVAGGALLMWLVWRRRVHAALYFSACAAVPPAIWLLWSGAHLPADRDPVTSYYFDYTGRWLQAIHNAGLGTMILKNLTYGVVALGGLLIASKSLLLLRAARDVILAGLGAAAIAESPISAFTAVAIGTASFQLFWLGTPDSRLLLTVSPAFLGAAVATFQSWPRIFRIAPLVVALADLYGTQNLAAIYSTERARLAALAPAYRFIEAELPSDAVILGDEQVWIGTGRRVIGMPMPLEYFYSNQADSAVDGFYLHYRDVAREFGAGYILITPWDLERSVRASGERFFAAIRADPDLRKMFSSNGVELFRVR